MRLDRFSNPIFNEQDIFDALYQGHIDVLSKVTVDSTIDIQRLGTVSDTEIISPVNLDDSVTLQDYDSALQTDWFMPNEYKIMDIEAWVWEQCPPWDPQHSRVKEELEAFSNRNMLDVLRWMKYFVDTCSKEQVLWGVGRGSSVASYVLYLIGVHSVDSIKYNLDWREFLR
jgi:hypothetical protein